ncbi:unnamed protein product [Miscanthus lutarioriparius]|uniref:Uncharacterized protein n=1 Tax=Miscanthus lutarioriparius TaxID=422564 RepID=A0A811S0Z9_9POAL|nr:unnamed protein product [Miscanthus lutarioriparius]
MGSSLTSCCGSEKVEQGCVSASPMSSTWRIFSYKELQAATNGFSEENKLGEGGFGSVYWGKTSDGLQGEPDHRPDMRTVVRILRGDNAAAAATVGRAGKGDQKVPVRIESVKYADRLMEMDKSSSYYDEPQDWDEEEEEGDDIDDDKVEYSMIDDKSSMNFGAFGAMPVQQTMHDPYVKRISGNANAIKI